MWLSNELAKLDVPVKLLIDSAVAYTMDDVDMVLVGWRYNQLDGHISNCISST